MSVTKEIHPSYKDVPKIQELPTGVIGPDIQLDSDIPDGSFLFDYPSYVKRYEGAKAPERAPELELLKELEAAAEQARGTSDEDAARNTYKRLKDELTERWGGEFDNDIIAFLQALLILHKDITFRMRSKDTLYWYWRLIESIEGANGEPGRPDKEAITIRLCKLPTEKTLGKVATAATEYTAERGQKAA
ncbi:hypothetical protein EOL96_06760 [Candidatus Saccharibacteria bacterium]|nr:hypothetical protein [Candidatus Saccharibacteria bacterium]